MSSHWSVTTPTAKLLTTAQAAAQLGVSPSTVRGYVERGLLTPAERIGTRLNLFAAADVATVPEKVKATGRPKRKDME